MKKHMIILFIIELLLFFYSSYVFFATWTIVAFSFFPLQNFDGALRLLPHYYMKQGFAPYLDFNTFYPPGLILFIGKIIPFISVQQRNLILSLLILMFCIILTILLLKLRTKNRWLVLPAALLTFYNTGLLFEFQWGEPLSAVLMAIIVVLLVMYLQRGKQIVLFFIGFCSFLVTWLKWNHIVSLLLMQILICVVLYFLVRFNKLDQKIIYRRYLAVTTYQFLGIVGGFSTLLLYLYSIHALHEGIDFIFHIPLLILKYRMLPITSFHFESFSNIIMLIPVFVLVLNVVTSLVVIKKNYKDSNSIITVIVALLPIFLLPYSFGRLDEVHLWILLYLVSISTLIIYVTQRTRVTLIAGFCLLLPIWFYLTPLQPYFPKHEVYLTSNLNQALKNCKEQVKDVKYSSLFVGRVSYEKYVYNVVALYFINPDVRPATPYITDDPGIQNSHYYGSIIASQLHSAPKPMLAFLDTTREPTEPNATKTMYSAGKIEQYLSQNKHDVLGICQAYNHVFVIHLYN